MQQQEKSSKPSLFYSLTILTTVVAIISVGLLVFEASIQMMLFISIITIIPFIMKLGSSYKDVEKMWRKQFLIPC